MSLLKELKKLAKDGLVIEKDYGDLVLYKYHNKVFYNNLWCTSPALLEARGIVFDKSGKVVQRPFHKCFNVGENGTELPDLGTVECYRKVNGFMAAASIHNSELFVSTTGTIDSEYQKLACNLLQPYELAMRQYPHLTFIFEVCDQSDPHIVDEEDGIYLLSARIKETGEYLDQRFCQGVAIGYNMYLPEPCEYDLTEQHEGFMFYSFDGTPLCKVKTPHYLSKKALMRLGKGRAKSMWDNPSFFKMSLDEEFYGLLDYIVNTYTAEDWVGVKEQERRVVIEEYFNLGGR
jgi:hypothetical protein